MMRGLVAAIGFLCAALTAPNAVAQIPLPLPEIPEYRDINLGDRETGRSYPLILWAQNRNCPQPLDFRFTSKTPWLRMPADPVARQILMGQRREIEATLDLTNAAPGRRQAFVDVDCENCGFLIFKNCKIDKQQLRLNLNVVAAARAAGPQANQQADVQQSPQIDYDDKRIPKRLRDKAKAAYDAWQAALKKLSECEAKLAQLRAAAAQADADSDKAKRAAETAEQDARNARAQAEAAQEELKQANKESIAAQEALEEAEKKLADANRNGTTRERNEANAAVDKAKAAKEAADKRVSDAKKGVGLHSPRELDEMDKEAKKKGKAAGEAAAAAAAAAAALSKKEQEYAHHKAEADAAQAAKDAAEKEAKDAIPGPAAGPTPEEIEAQRKKVEDCHKKIGALIEAQYKALKAMAALGALNDDDAQQFETDLKAWADAIDDTMDIFDEVPPGIPYVSDNVDFVNSILEGIRAVMGLYSGVNYTGNLYHVPRSGNDVVSPPDTKEWLKEKGLANGEDVDLVYDQMKAYSETNSTEAMQKDLETAKAACKAEEEKLAAMENAAAKPK